MTIEGLDHYTIDTADMEASLAFYGDVLGLAPGDRPPFKFPGAWLYCGDAPIVHLIAKDEAAATHTGSFNHVAFRGTGLDGFTAHLESLGVAFTRRDVPGRQLRQVFIEDPNGITIEVNFRGEA
jgi:catechol 2,3-dioxygenase-like lactoylglutathione lyase family enzyme